jgi:hypothetical protein
MIEENLLYNKNGGKDSIFGETTKGFVYFLHIVFSDARKVLFIRRLDVSFSTFACLSVGRIGRGSSVAKQGEEEVQETTFKGSSKILQYVKERPKPFAN